MKTRVEWKVKKQHTCVPSNRRRELLWCRPQQNLLHQKIRLHLPLLRPRLRFPRHHAVAALLLFLYFYFDLSVSLVRHLLNALDRVLHLRPRLHSPLHRRVVWS